MMNEADKMQNAADRIESAAHRIGLLLDDGYGGNGPRLIEALEKASCRKSLDQIADEAHANAKAHGFHDMSQPESVFLANQLMNLIGEASELWEAHRAGTLRDPCDKAEKMKAMGLRPLTCMEEEYADIIIRALDQCRRLGVDIYEAIQIKHEYNKTRPHMHGKKN